MWWVSVAKPNTTFYIDITTRTTFKSSKWIWRIQIKIWVSAWQEKAIWVCHPVWAHLMQSLFKNTHCVLLQRGATWAGEQHIFLLRQSRSYMTNDLRFFVSASGSRVRDKQRSCFHQIVPYVVFCMRISELRRGNTLVKKAEHAVN